MPNPLPDTCPECGHSDTWHGERYDYDDIRCPRCSREFEELEPDRDFGEFDEED